MAVGRFRFSKSITMIAAGPSNGVVCQRCRKPIKLERTERVAEEFSLACPHCSFRGIYRVKDIKPLGNG
jgi:DNA-directed RNA polymerase subunit RPC12/RpoP